MSTSRGRAEDVYESQNDQRLDELHSKIRTLRGVRLFDGTHDLELGVDNETNTDNHRHSRRCGVAKSHA